MSEFDATITAQDLVTGELERAAGLLAVAGIRSFSEALDALTETIRRATFSSLEMVEAMRRFGRRRRSGHRHCGTRAWHLRYAMASDAPLGQRTAAKLRERPLTV